MPKDKTKSKQNIQRSALADLSWQLLDVICDELHVQNYQKLKAKHIENADGYEAFTTELKFHNNINRLQSEMLQKKFDNEGYLALQKSTSRVIKKITEVLSAHEGDDKVTFSPRIYAVLLTLENINWYAVVGIWKILSNEYRQLQYQRFSDTSTKTLRSVSETIKEFDFSSIREMLSINKEFFQKLTTICTNDFAKQIKGRYNMFAESLLYQIGESGDQKNSPFVPEAFEAVLSNKKKMSEENYYWSLATLNYIVGDLQATKKYFYRYKANLIHNLDTTTVDGVTSLAALTNGICNLIMEKIGQVSENPYLQLAFYKEALTYSYSSKELFDINFSKAIQKLKNSKEPNETQMAQQQAKAIQNLMKLSEQRIKTIKDKILKIKMTLLENLNTENLTFSINQGDDNNVVVLNLKSAAETRQMLLNLLYYRGINCEVGSEVGEINFRDIINVPLSDIMGSLNSWVASLPKEKNQNNTTAERIQKAYDEAKIPQYPASDETYITKSQRKKLRGKPIESHEPTVREQAENEVKEIKAKEMLRPEKIIFAGVNGQEDYVYTEQNSNVHEMRGKGLKNHFVMLHPKLLAYLAEKHDDTLVQLQRLCDYGTTLNTSTHHSCFIVSSDEFLETKENKGLWKFFDDEVVPTDTQLEANNTNNANNINNNTQQMDFKPRHVKAKLIGEEDRFFGKTIRKTTVDEVDYYLMELNIYKPKK